MRATATLLLGFILALNPLLGEGADAKRVSALRALATYWATQSSSVGGWLENGLDPGFVPVVPPDSSLWEPGSLLLISPEKGLQKIGSKENLDSRRGPQIQGMDRGDIATLDSLTFGNGSGEKLPLRELAGALEALGAVRLHSSTLAEDLETELVRQGISRVTLSMPNAQVHRLPSSDLEIYLERLGPLGMRQLLAKPGVCLITSAVFLRTVRLRLEATRETPGFDKSLGKLLGLSLRRQGEGTLDLESGGVYVAVQASTYGNTKDALETQPKDSLLVDATQELRGVVDRLLARLDAETRSDQ